MLHTKIIFVVLALAVSLLCGLLIIPQIVDYCNKRKLFDRPNIRKQHKTLVPRLGGICFLPCMGISFVVATLALYFLNDKQTNISLASVYQLIGVMMVYLVGMLDDVVGVSANRKLVVQILSACCLPLANLYINNLYGLFGIGQIPAWVGMPLTVFFVVAVDNAMNLIDGIDGLCAGLSIIALAGFGMMFAGIDFWVYCVIIAGLIGVLLSYSYFNMFSTRRKIFMGDSGSLTLGFLMAVFFVKLSMNNPLLAPYDGSRMIMAASFLIVPCFDVARVMMERKRLHKPMFSPDRNHIHHRLIDAGCTQHQALGVILALDLCFVAMNCLLLWFGVQFTVILITDIVVFVLFHYLLQLKISNIKQRQ
jgi:UDP-GlcNAc:undecaprenyl-phosphate/decaprenyl-phosphate GlcNAc-1-phosphate transferase